MEKRDEHAADTTMNGRIANEDEMRDINKRPFDELLTTVWPDASRAQPPTHVAAGSDVVAKRVVYRYPAAVPQSIRSTVVVYPRRRAPKARPEALRIMNGLTGA
jgi:hypothetical protein